MENHLHIVMAENPFPADAPNLADAYFMIKALKTSGIRVHLHCFDESYSKRSIPADFFDSTDFYEREKTKISFSPDLPYHVSSRSDHRLVERLNKDQYPILFFGLNTTYSIYSKSFQKDRKIAIRLSRNESAYYQDLAEIVPWRGKKIHFQIEAWRFGNYIKKLTANKITFFATPIISTVIQKTKKDSHLYTLPVFTGFPALFHYPEKGSFCLFHGRLSNKETAYAAFWLLEHVFNTLEIPFVIAGSDPSPELERAAHVRSHTCLVSNPSDKEMMELIKKAQLLVNPSFIRIEENEYLNQSLSLGRHVLINSKSTKDKKAREICHLARTPEEFTEKAKQLFETGFSEDEKFSRQSFLNDKFKDDEGLAMMLKWLL
jgi:hypothetical protein